MARSLWPREHGAYVQLAAPLGAAFVAIGANAPSVLFAFGGVLAFMLNESLLVVLGHRGSRRKQQDGDRAWRTLVVLAPLALVAGLCGFALASPAARVCAVLATAAAAFLIVLAWRRQERSLVGQLVAATVLSGAAAPTAVAAGMAWSTALVVWGGWTIGYASTVIGVHRVIARHRRAATRRDHQIVACLVIATLAIVACSFISRYALVALPLVVSALAMVVAAPPANRLRRIGFALVGASLCSVAIVVACWHVS